MKEKKKPMRVSGHCTDLFYQGSIILIHHTITQNFIAVTVGCKIKRKLVVVNSVII
jgi:hypothetical protein